MRIPEAVLNRMLTRSLRERGWFRSVESEVILGCGRADIIAEQPDGALCLFELKAGALKQRDITQVLRYATWLEGKGHTVHTHLVGDGWANIERPPNVVLLDWSYFWQGMA